MVSPWISAPLSAPLICWDCAGQLGTAQDIFSASIEKIRGVMDAWGKPGSQVWRTGRPPPRGQVQPVGEERVDLLTMDDFDLAARAPPLTRQFRTGQALTGRITALRGFRNHRHDRNLIQNKRPQRAAGTKKSGRSGNAATGRRSRARRGGDLRGPAEGSQAEPL